MTRGRRPAVAALAVAGALALGELLARGATATLAALGADLSPTLHVWLSTLLVQGVAFVGVAAVVHARTDLTLSGVGWTPADGALASAFGAYLLSMAAGAVSVRLLGLAGLEPVPVDGVEPTVGTFLMLALLSVLVIGPGEELLFRPTVQRYLKGALPTPVAVLGATVLFAAAHAAPLGGAAGLRVYAALGVFLPGLVLAVWYERTGSIWVPVAVHAGYDATLFGLDVLVFAAGQ